MTTLIPTMSWWPWPQEGRAIRNVRRDAQAPGLVTLAWNTGTACPTVLVRRDGTELFRNDVPARDHSVTLTGGTGQREVIVIRAPGHSAGSGGAIAICERIVEVDF